ncbi:hypothetical protein ASE63_17590 [Bosea sp. Root381]|uniref:hypothetical protein n=1 Tax=Bosea sp. Root381 TaxID=1736524 RepID=UPI0007152638|nr:hypothetical protein [Bosea sp. Root381]KRE15054.1 hypothetical protein ASE63_17590 [Bosea sp. Root381]
MFPRELSVLSSRDKLPAVFGKSRCRIEYLEAIFTDRVAVAHVIRKVLLRQIAITNYVNPF